MTREPEPREVAQVRAALRLACASVPHLAGLAAAVRIHVDRRVPTAAITASGRLLVNPDWLLPQPLRDQAFIMAHELFHLCLRSHDRGEGTDPRTFNWAHDYIINDMLRHQMGVDIPAGGLDHEGARNLSAEQMVRMIRDGAVRGPKKQPRGLMTIALAEAGLLPPEAHDRSTGDDDVMSGDRERELFPDADPRQDADLARRVQAAAAKSLSLGLLKDRIDQIEQNRGQTDHAGGYESIPGLLKSFYRPPWEMALQQWMEAVAPGPRSFARPSRRAGDRADVVLPGRRREGWTLHIVLDTSGSMVSEIPRVLGTIASFCDAVDVTTIHVLQCDTAVTHDDWLDPAELARYPVAGGGGSDMSPALWHLADDPQVQAAVVLTDGMISYPSGPLPFDVLWALTDEYDFDPPYGTVMRIPRER